ncbi:MAG: hypothetical protein Kow0037_28080 [Calditrichia bacterium]
MRLIFTILFLLVISLNLLYGQNQELLPAERHAKQLELQQRQDQRAFTVARTLIAGNQYQQAIPILKDLHQRNITNKTYYQYLLEAYLATDNLEAAEFLVSGQLSRFPRDLRYQIDLAQVWFQKGNKETALKSWEQILEENPQNINAYMQVANALLRVRQLDEAIRVYIRAVENVPHSDHLYQSIANIYQNRLMFEEAAEYYLKYLKRNPKQEQFVFSRILSFDIPEEKRDGFIKSLGRLADNLEPPQKIKLLQGQLYQKFGDYEKAFQYYRNLDRDLKNERYLLQFAHAAHKDSSYQLAIKAYRMVLESYPKSPRRLEVVYHLAQSYFNLAEQQNNSEAATRAVALLDQTIAAENRKETAALRYLKGYYLLNYFFDVDAAGGVFEELLRENLQPLRRDQVLLQLAEIELIRGNLEKAQSLLASVRSANLLPQAMLQISRLLFFRQEWEGSLAMCDSTLKRFGFSSEAANDLLQMRSHLALAQKQPGLAEKLSQAELLLARRQKSQALERFREIASDAYVPAGLKSYAYQKAIGLSLQLDDPESALGAAAGAVADSTLRDYADRFLYFSADILQHHLGREEDAMQIYTELLRDFPESAFAEPARQRLRALQSQRKNGEMP